MSLTINSGLPTYTPTDKRPNNTPQKVDTVKSSQTSNNKHRHIFQKVPTHRSTSAATAIASYNSHRELNSFIPPLEGIDYYV